MKILLVGRVSIDIFLDSNFSKVGGTIFNIAKTLISNGSSAELTLIAPVGNDDYQAQVNQGLKDLKINIIKLNVDKTPTETYLNSSKTLDVYNLEELVTEEKLIAKKSVLNGYDVIVADLHFLTIIKLLAKLNPNATVFIDATSQMLVARLETLKLSNMVVKFNRKQASIFSNHILYDSIDFYEVMHILKNKGIAKAIITLDKDGCFYYDKNNQGLIRADVITNKKYFDAGDSFHAGMIHGFTLSHDLAFMAKTGIEFSAKQIMKEIDASFVKSLMSDK